MYSYLGLKRTDIGMLPPDVGHDRTTTERKRVPAGHIFRIPPAPS
ncbi:hypothetical protein SNOG_02285 [Parastagonospora nodorum SN15]|uniref:Uncharacterized protein n=1 Tax=Phaeosphaeria nodorum (strain SN15 / ATCC MYA-4574 / FGSC 10173) TaxID=321614 RepID=Q0V129_PHANO|nr:hypothetical protein SNOG_02285 [Parastagonospora nodorum SN15]EAT90497.1 hypothetical protein SNOG_02285 [Parastagonospora nodorum SN15]